MNDRITKDEIKDLAAEIAERIAGAGSGDIDSSRWGTARNVCPPRKLCCFQGYNCDAPFACADGFRCPNGFGAGVMGTLR